MKIALITETYPPEVNGVAMTLSRVVSGLRANGHTVEVIRPRQAGETGAGRSGDFLVPGMPIPSYATLRIGLPVARRLRARWQRERPEVVHVATEGPLGWAALHVARRMGVPTTSSFHTNFHDYGQHYGILGFLRGGLLAYLRWFHNRTACTMAPTREMCAALETAGFARLTVMARGVDGELFDPRRRSEVLRRSWGAEPKDPVFIYVGRLAAEKNLALAVETFLAVRAREPRARFVFVGDGPERARLVEQYSFFNYAGMRRGEDLAAHYASADVFVFPSLTETFGNVVTEALASGLVTLAFDYAAAREHVKNGENGLVAPCDDPATFVRQAVETLDRREAWPEMRRRARETALALTWGKIVDKFASDLAEAVAG